MATLNIGGRTVEVPDNLDLPRQQLRTPPMGAVSNPNVAKGILSSQGADWQRSRAAPAPAAAAPAPAAAAPAPAAPQRPGMTDRLRNGVSGARQGVATARTASMPPRPEPTGMKAAAGKAGRFLRGAGAIGAGVDAVRSFNDYKINDPDVDSSASGTLGYLAGGEFGQAGRSLSKGMLETGMDAGSWGARTLDMLPGVDGMSDAYRNKLRGAFGDQLIDNTGGSAPGAPDATQAAQGDPTAAATPGGAGSGIQRIGGGSSSLFTNVGADDNAALMGRGAVSAQNMGAADNLAQRSAALRQGAAAPQSDMILNSKAEVFGESGGFGLLDRNRLRQRELSMDAQQFKPGARTNLRAFNEQQINNDRFASEERVAQVKDATTRRGQDVDAASREYASDQTLRGQMYDANASAASAQAKAAGELAGKQNDLDVTNAKRTEEMFASYSREGQPDPAATKNKMLALNKIIPGFTTMSEQARNQHQGDAAALSSIFDRARSQKELGLGQAIFGNDNPTLDSMPNFKGWALKRSGLAGALPGGAGVNGYYMEKDGQQFELGEGLSERELAMLKHNAATGKWIPSEK